MIFVRLNKKLLNLDNVDFVELTESFKPELTIYWQNSNEPTILTGNKAGELFNWLCDASVITISDSHTASDKSNDQL